MSELRDLTPQEIGQKKRIEKLIEKGVYKKSVTENLKCKHCQKEFIIKYTNFKNLYAHFRHGYCSKECYIDSGEYNKQREIGQQKRIKKLIDSNKYHEPNIITQKCKYCNLEFSFDKDKKNNKTYFLKGFCCDKCYYNSGEKFINKFKKELENIGVNCDGLMGDDIMKKYSEYLSQRTHNSLEKWRETHYNKYLKYNTNFFHERSLKGREKRVDDFLLEFNLLSPEEIKIKDYKFKSKLFKDNFNKLTNHGCKCKNGRLKKCGYDLSIYKESFIKGLKKQVMNYINSNYTKDELDGLTDDEFKTLYDKTYKYLFSEKRMGAKSKEQLKKWKISNIFNNYGNYQIEELEQMSDDEINRIYSEYHSLRITELRPTYGGYKKTKKGWYEFSDGTMFFYRSSWEFDTCEKLNGLLFNCVKKIETPEPIVYEYDGIKHHYFADIKVTYNNGKIIYFEIKPERRVSDERNQNKFYAAKKMWDDNFVILTENEIYSKNFKKTLKDYGKLN